MSDGSEHIIDAQRDLFLYEAMHSPVPHVLHDSCAHRDSALRRLVRDGGMEAYGRYWLLVELLTGLPEHQYEVADEVGWEMFAADMSRLEATSPDECKTFVGRLAELGLIDREAYDEVHVVAIRRVLRDVEKYAQGTAKRKLGAWMRHNNVAAKKG